MKTKPFQTLLKVWITVASLAAFLFGWIVLGHSGKPVTSSSASAASTTSSEAAVQLAPLPTLAPLAPVGSTTTLQTLPQIQSQAQQPSSSFTPRFRTRGS
jgi:hypothetical protein